MAFYIEGLDTDPEEERRRRFRQLLIDRLQGRLDSSDQVFRNVGTRPDGLASESFAQIVNEQRARGELPEPILSRENLESRGLGFLTQPPTFGRIDRPFAKLGQAIGRGATGHPVGALKALGGAGLAALETAQEPFTSGTAVQANISQLIDQLMGGLGTSGFRRSNVPDETTFGPGSVPTDETGSGGFINKARESLMANLASTLPVAPIAQTPVLGGLKGLPRLAAELAWPGGQLEATAGIARGAAKAPGAAAGLAKGAGVEASYRAGKMLEEVKPQLAWTLEQPKWKRFREGLDWPEVQVPMEGGTTAAGSVMETARIQQLVNGRRSWEFRVKKQLDTILKTQGEDAAAEFLMKSAGGPEGFALHQQQTGALDAMFKALDSQAIPSIVVKRGSEKEYADLLGQLTQARSDHLAAAARAKNSEVAAQKLESLLYYVEEPKPVATGGPRSLPYLIRKAMGQVDPTMNTAVVQLRDKQKKLQELNQIIPEYKQQAEDLWHQVGALQGQIRDALPEEAKNSFDFFMRAQGASATNAAKIRELEATLEAVKTQAAGARTPAVVATERALSMERAKSKDYLTGVVENLQKRIAEGKAKLQGGRQAAEQNISDLPFADMEVTERSLGHLGVNKANADERIKQIATELGVSEEEAAKVYRQQLGSASSRRYAASGEGQVAGLPPDEAAAIRNDLRNLQRKLSAVNKKLGKVDFSGREQALRAVPGVDFDQLVGASLPQMSQLQEQALSYEKLLKETQAQKTALAADITGHAKVVRDAAGAAHAKVVTDLRHTLFRPFGTEEATAPFYALTDITVAGNAKRPGSYERVAVLRPVQPEEVAQRGSEAAKLVTITQRQKELVSAEESLQEMRRDVLAKQKAFKQAKAGGDPEAVKAAEQEYTNARNARSGAQKQANELRDVLKNLAIEVGPNPEKVAAALDKQSIRVPLDSMDQTFIRYTLAKNKVPKLKEGGIYDARLKHLRQQLDEADSSFADLDRRAEAFNGELIEAQNARAQAVPGTPDWQEAGLRIKEIQGQMKGIDRERGNVEKLENRLQEELASTNRERFVKVYQAQQESKAAQEAYVGAQGRYQTLTQQLQDLELHPTLGNTKPGTTIESYRAELSKRSQDRLLQAVTEKVEQRGPMMDEDLAGFTVDLVRKLYQPLSKDIKFEAQFKDLNQRLEQVAPRLSVAEAFRLMVAPWEFYSDKVFGSFDKGGMYGGPLGWVKRIIMGSGFKNPEFSALTSTLFNQENVAAFQVKATFGDMYQQAGKIAADFVRSSAKMKDAAEEARAAKTTMGKIPAYIARNILKMDDHERMLSALLGQYAHPPEHPIWNSAIWKHYADMGENFALTEAEKKAVYDHITHDFTSAALFPELFRPSQMPLSLRQTLEAYHDSYFTLEQTAREYLGVTWSRSSLLRYDLRDLYAAKGNEFFGLAGGKGRNPLGGLLGDYVQAARKITIGHQSKGGMRQWLAANEGLPSAILGKSAEGTREMPLSLDQMFVTGPDKAEALPAIIYKRMSEKEFENKLVDMLAPGSSKTDLRDWTAGGKWAELKGSAHWKDPSYADDWAKLRGMMERDEPSGIWKIADQGRRAFNTVAMGILMGDASILSIQWPFLIALNPKAAGKALVHMLNVGGNIWSDNKFSMYMLANQDILQMAVARGLGLGLEAYVGARFKSGSLWEHLPLTRPFGKAAKYVNDIHFNRFMTVLKLEAIKTNLHTAQMMRAVGPAMAAPYLDQLPGLNKLNKEVDVMQAAPMDVFDAVVRTVNNQFGGVPRSQSQIGVMREFFEQGAFIVPGFFRARAGLVGQMSRALRNPTSVEGWLAAQVISKELLYTQFMGGAISAMHGESGQWLTTRADPRKTEFWMAFTGKNGEGIRIAPSPPAMQLYTRLATGMEGWEGLYDPKQKLEVLKRFASGRENPVLSQIVKQINGKDFFGNDRTGALQRTIAAMESVLPVWMQSAATNAEDQLYKNGRIDPRTLGVQTAWEFMGQNYRVPNPYTELNNRFVAWQQANYPDREPLDWANPSDPGRSAPQDVRDLAKKNDPELEKLETRWLNDRARKQTTEDKWLDARYNQFNTDMKELDGQLAQASDLAQRGGLDYEKWADAYRSIQQTRTTKAEDLRSDLLQAGIDLTKKSDARLAGMQQGRGPMESLALAEYRAVDMPTKDKIVTLSDGSTVATKVPDFDTFDAERQKVLDAYPANVRQSVLDAVGPKDPVAIRYKAAQKDLNTYLDSIPKYRGMTVPQSKYVDFLISVMRKADKRVSQEGLGSQIPRKDLYLAVLKQLAQKGKINQAQIGLAGKALTFALNSDAHLLARAPENLQYLKDHPDMIRFFSWMRGEVPIRMYRFLPEDLKAKVDSDMMQERYLQDTPLSGITS